MKDSSRGRRLTLRFVLLQIACGAVVALAFLVFAGPASAQAAFAGALIVAVGNAVFGWRMFAPGIAPPDRLARALYAGEVLKWLWTVVALWLAFAVAHLAPLPLLLGLIAAHLGFWLGAAWIR
jgi:F0F1-type ATP synthase assembly protein I